MLYEIRTYRLSVGTVPDYLARFVAHGLPHLSRHLPLLGYWAVEAGRGNTIHHLWAYRHWAERATRRSALASDTGWAAFTVAAFPLIRDQQSAILTLEAGSAALDQALARRDQPLDTATLPLFADSFASFEWHDDRPDPGPGAESTVALWRVSAGLLHPAWIRLAPRSAEPPPPLPNAQRHEVLRPLSLSPL